MITGKQLEDQFERTLGTAFDCHPSVYEPRVIAETDTQKMIAELVALSDLIAHKLRLFTSHCAAGNAYYSALDERGERDPYAEFRTVGVV